MQVGNKKTQYKNKKQCLLKHLLYEENPSCTEPVPLPYSAMTAEVGKMSSV